jgi:hypothetical protein
MFQSGTVLGNIKMQTVLSWSGIRESSDARFPGTGGPTWDACFRHLEQSTIVCSMQYMTNNKNVTNILDDHTEESCGRSQTQLVVGGGDDYPPLVYRKDQENIPSFFDEEQSPTIILDDESERLDAAIPRAEFSRWYYRLGHTSFAKLKLMAALGIFPRILATVQSPKCLGCIFGAMTKKPWRTKAHPKVKNVVVRVPGECVSVDQLESSTPGVVAQLKVIITKRRYTCATVFVDHFSRLGHVYLQQQLTSNETVEAKHAFEDFSRSQGVTIKNHHADNGRCADNDFMKYVRVARPSQSITFCGIKTHFQNGIAETR